MKPIRVLIVDDSTVIRRLLTDSLSGDPTIEVVGVAANGKIALAKIPQLKPDLITLDIEMPEMDGLSTLIELRKLYPKLPVIMFSTLTQQGAEATLDALARGASDYVTKPANVGSVNVAIQSVQSDLIPKIKSLAGKNLSSGVTKPVAIASTPKPTTSNLQKAHRIDLVVIGTSTGGPSALINVVPKLPVNFPVPILIVQHMPPVFTTHLAQRLDGMSNLRVHEAQHGDLIREGTVWLAPGNFHMALRRHGVTCKIVLNQDAPENSCRPAVDVLFRSAASTFGPNVLSVVMTGMGQDGQLGCQSIQSSGGRIVAQDESTSVVWGMPGAVVRAGLANHIVPLDKIANEIMTHIQIGRGARTQELAKV